MMREIAVPLADGGLIKLIFFAVVGLIYLISHLINNANKKRPQPPPARQPQQMPPARANPDPRDEVGEFLRRAAQRREAERQGAERSVSVPPQQPVRSRQRSQARSSPPAEAPLEAEVVAAPSGASVAEHVRQHLDTGEFSRRASSLAQVPHHVTQAIESHVHEVFDHQVGRLASQPTVTTQEAPAVPAPQVQLGLAAAGLAPLLANRERLREAVILTEILRSPLERW